MNVIDNTARLRFEMNAQGQTCFIDYRRNGSVVSMTHAEVPPELEGRGLGSALTKGALDLVRARNETVVPVCPFIAVYIQRHPEYQPLLARS